MAITHTLTWSYRDSSGNTVSSQTNVSDDSENNYDNSAISLPATLFAAGWAATLTQLQSLEVYCDHAVIVETNESATALTDLVIDASNDLKVTSAGHSFVSGDVGKYVVVVGGTSFTVGAYKIASVTGGAAILASSPGATSLTGGHWHLSDDYFLLQAGQNLIWALSVGGLAQLPFAFNVTDVYLTISGTGTAAFKIRAIQHV